MTEYWNAIIIVISVSADAVSHDSSLGTSCLSSYDRKTVYSAEKNLSYRKVITVRYTWCLPTITYHTTLPVG